MRQITCLIAWLGFMGMTWSQSEPSLPWTFKGGLVGGVTTSQIRGDRADGFNKFGLHGGAMLEMRRYANLGFQLGIVYNEKGSRKVQYPKIGDFTTWRYKFSYFDIPITAIYDWRDGITVGAGLQPSVLINALEDGITTGSVTGDWNPTALPIRKYELAWVLWVGMRRGESGEWFVRHTQSLLSIAPRPEIVNPVVRRDDRMLNVTLQAGYAWFFSRAAKDS